MRDYQPELGKVIRERRAEMELGSIMDFAEVCGLNKKTVQSVESGRGYSMKTLTDIAAALNLTVDELNKKALDRRTDNQSARATINGILTPRAVEINSENLQKFIAEIDSRIHEELGRLYSPTRRQEVEFSSYRLFRSLSLIDIPPDIILEIMKELPGFLHEVVGQDKEFTTGHVRAAVAKAISGLPISTLQSSYKAQNSGPAANGKTEPTGIIETLEDKKHEWAKRYARKYGDPNQTTQIVMPDGTEVPLDFKFLKDDLIPNLLTDCLGYLFEAENSDLISPHEIAEMSEIVLNELRRINLYNVKYTTAMSLAEDIAIQPPNPWIVTTRTRLATIAYDQDRASKHLETLRSISSVNDEEFWYRYREFVHHCCSLILATYGGFLGHKNLHSLYVLRNWLSIEDQNTVLWNYCELRHISHDLARCGHSLDEFGAILKKLELFENARRSTEPGGLVSLCNRLSEISEGLFKRRQLVRNLKLQVSDDLPLSNSEFIDLCRDSIAAIFSGSRTKLLKDRTSNNQVGFLCTIDFSEGPLSTRSPVTVFRMLNGPTNSSTLLDCLESTKDLLNAHRLCEVGLIIHDTELSAMDSKIIDNWNSNLDDPYVVLCLRFNDICSCSLGRSPKKDFNRLIVDHI